MAESMVPSASPEASWVPLPSCSLACFSSGGCPQHSVWLRRPAQTGERGGDRAEGNWGDSDKKGAPHTRQKASRIPGVGVGEEGVLSPRRHRGPDNAEPKAVNSCRGGKQEDRDNEIRTAV